MSELKGVRHLGWRCTARSCGAEIAYQPSGDLEADRKASQAVAETAGWVFTHDMPARWDGTEYRAGRPNLQYCPKHAPVAAAKKALRLARLAAGDWP